MSTPLSNKYAFAALRDKRAEIAGRVAALHKEIGRLQRDLAKVDGVIRLFDPSYRVGSIPAKGARQRLNLFKQGELGRLILDCLRKAPPPPPTAAIVAYVADAIGQPDARKVVAKTVATNLAYMARRHKTVAKVGERAAARWPDTIYRESTCRRWNTCGACAFLERRAYRSRGQNGHESRRILHQDRRRLPNAGRRRPSRKFARCRGTMAVWSEPRRCP